MTADLASLLAEGKGDRAIARILGVTRHRARELIREQERGPGTEVALAEPQTVAEFIERISGCWRKSREQVIEAGRLIMRAKERLDHGEFAEMIKSQLPFGQRTAEMLMEIAQDARLANPKFVSHLPNAWGTLYEITRLETPVFEAKIADGTIRPDMKRNDISTVIKQERRIERERELGKRQRALPEKRYGVILADPPWKFEPYSDTTGMDRAADNHYPTQTTDAIAALDVRSIAADDCVLLLWATVPMLPQALEVMKSWGFEYRSNFVWVKDRVGTGYWNRNQHEHLLIGVCGVPPAPALGTRELSVIQAHVGEHSEKPEIVLDYIEGWYPTLPKIELNRRGPAREGWDAWGNEAE